MVRKKDGMEEQEKEGTRLPPFDPSKWVGGTTPQDQGGPCQSTRKQQAALKASMIAANQDKTMQGEDGPEEEYDSGAKDDSVASESDGEEDYSKSDESEAGAVSNKAKDGSKPENVESGSEPDKNSRGSQQGASDNLHVRSEARSGAQNTDANSFVLIKDDESCSTSLFALTEKQAFEILLSALGPGFDPSGDWSRAKKKKQLGITCANADQYQKAVNIQDFKSMTAGIKLVSSVPQRKCWGVVRLIHRHVYPDLSKLKDHLIGAKVAGLDADAALEACVSNITFTRRNTVVKLDEDRKRVYQNGKLVTEETNSVQFCYKGERLPEELRFSELGPRKVEPYAFKVQHCWRCLGYNHSGRDCKSIACHCGFCGGPHTTRDCDQKDKSPVCFYCKQSHPVWSSECPRRRQEQELAQIRAGTTMTRGMAWAHLKEKERKKEDQNSRNIEIRKQVIRMENNLNQEIEEINKHAEQELQRQMDLIHSLAADYKRLEDNYARDQAKAKEHITELQRENRGLRKELDQVRRDVEELKTGLCRREERQPQKQTHFGKKLGDYDPMEVFENRDIVWRTDDESRRPTSPPRRPSHSPSHARKERNYREMTQAHETPRKHTRFPPYVSRSAKKGADAAVAQWESRYEEQGARHQCGPMKSVSYAKATGATLTRTGNRGARRSLVRQ